MAFLLQRSVTIDHTKLPADETEFKLVILGTYTWLRTIANGGDIYDDSGPGGSGPGLCDIQFTSDSAGATILNWEVEYYNPVTGAVAIWVKIPSISSSVDTVFYFWYSDPATNHQTQSSYPLVWADNTSFTDPAGYILVLHFGSYAVAAPPTFTSALDSSANNSDGSAIGSPTTISTGQIDGGLSLNGTSAAVTIPSFNMQNAGATDVSVEVWMKTTNASQNGMMVCKEPVNSDWELFLEGGNIKLRGGSTTAVTYACSTDTLWHKVVGTIQGTAGKLYLDGTLVSTGAVTAITNSANTTLEVGRYSESGGGYFFNGQLDEVRVSNTILTANRIRAIYNAESSPSTFYSISTATVAPTPPTPSVLDWATLIQGRQFGSSTGGGGPLTVSKSLRQHVKIGDLIAILAASDAGALSVTDNLGNTYTNAPGEVSSAVNMNCSIIWSVVTNPGIVTVSITTTHDQLWGVVLVYGDNAPPCDQGSLGIGFIQSGGNKYGVGMQPVYGAKTLLLSILTSENYTSNFSSTTGDSLLTVADLVVGGGRHTAGIYSKMITSPGINQIKLLNDIANDSQQACSAAFSKPLTRPGGTTSQLGHRPSAGNTPTYAGQYSIETILPYLPILGQRVFVGIHNRTSQSVLTYTLSDTYGNTYSSIVNYNSASVAGADPIAWYNTTVQHLPTDTGAFKVHCDFALTSGNFPSSGGIALVEYSLPNMGTPTGYNMASSVDQGGGYSLAKTSPATVSGSNILLCYAADGAFVSSPFPVVWTPSASFTTDSSLTDPQTEAAMSAFANATQLGVSAILSKLVTSGTYTGQIISNNYAAEPSIVMITIPYAAGNWRVYEA